MNEIFLNEQEIKNRIDICQNKLKENNLTGLVLTTESNVWIGYTILDKKDKNMLKSKKLIGVF